MIRKDADKIVMENPGYIRTGKDQMLKGGISEPRNKALTKMFNIIGIGERAGSGVPDIFDVWESQHWKSPVVEEQYNPDRTILTLPFVERTASKSQVYPKYRIDTLNDTLDDTLDDTLNNALDDTLNDTLEVRVLTLLKANPKMTQQEIGETLGISIASVKRVMKKLIEAGKIQREGGKKIGTWRIMG